MSHLRPQLAVAVATACALFGSGAANAAPTDLFFSEYIEGTSNNKALEIYNGTAAAIDLATGGYTIQMYFNGSSAAGLSIALTGSVASGDVRVVAQSAADPAILAQADQTNGAGWFNGDDAVVLRKGGTSGPILDVIGQIGFDPGTEWGSGLTSTADNTLRRKTAIEAGDTNGGDVFDPAVEWDGFATNTFENLGAHLRPAVFATVPADGASGVAPDASIAVTFSEPVTVSGSWYAIDCATSGPHSATVSGGPTTWTLDPDTNFAGNDDCTVTIVGAKVTDQDDTPDQMAASHVFAFQTLGAFTCGEPATKIHAIQGTGATAALTGTRTVEGVVVGDYQAANGLNGYFVQEEAADAGRRPVDVRRALRLRRQQRPGGE